MWLYEQHKAPHNSDYEYFATDSQLNVCLNFNWAILTHEHDLIWTRSYQTFYNKAKQ